MAGYTFNYTTIGSGQNTTFTDELKEKLLAKMVFEGRTAEIVKVIPGVKRAITLNLLANSAVPTEATCGWTPNPSKQYVNLDQKELKVLPLEVKDAICPKDFEQLYLGMYMRNNKEVPFEELIAESYVNVTKNYNEKLIWDGDSNNTGLLANFVSDLTTIDASSAVSSASNAIDAVNALLASATPDILMHTDKVVLTSYAMYNAYASELRAQNHYVQPNYMNGEGANYEMYIPGTDIRLIAIAGMDNLSNTTINAGYSLDSGNTYQPMVLTYADNIVLGTDMLNDEEMFDMWYSRDNDEVRVNIQYKLGWNFYFGDHIVRGYK